jgi:hypothetical protein
MQMGSAPVLWTISHKLLGGVFLYTYTPNVTHVTEIGVGQNMVCEAKMMINQIVLPHGAF